VVSEILAHEAAGLDIAIYALRPPVDSHFQDIIARVKAPVSYLLAKDLRGSKFWQLLQEAAAVLPDFWARLPQAQGEDSQDLQQAIALALAAPSQGITHFHAHFGTSATSVARLASLFSGIPYSFTAHAKDIYHQEVQPDDMARKLAAAKAVVTVSDYNRRFLKSEYGPAATGVQRIYNGLDLGQFPYQSPQDRPAQIVAVGRLVEKKGFADLIDACGLLVQKKLDFRCQIIGHGELAETLQQQIDGAGLQPWVALVGPRPQGELRAIVQGAAVLAAPCVVGGDGNQDGLPTVLLEAMALGTPCVSTDVTGIPEVVRHGETGLQVPQHNPAALAAALGYLLQDSALRVRLATAARRQIETNFDIHRNAAQLRQVFQSPISPISAATAVSQPHAPATLQEVRP